MTRGRKKDLTIPPSRSLLQQRDYRARKANYVASLEDRCRRAEEENAQLRKELFEARARLANPAILLPETEQASADLMRNLALASESLATFHRLAFSNGYQQPTPPPHPQHSPEPDILVPDYTPPNTLQLPPHPNNSELSKGRKLLYVDESLSPSTSRATPLTYRSPSPGTNEECCGGILNCDELCEEETMNRGSIARLSGLRSTTTDYRLQL
ncbi:hypothetical protein NLJ89_g4226 [Agrocybe chaxingu]|uniref:BZIP domain-containing protein n=1 Tax=Agrocybe chaxingu TaxID=84603 RepID=A0A9W8K397_9AGAR|nr:hypothetical protein NLJ89_g4226 [Agrocybe chaxingu]